jgi:ribosome-binding ATPase YchF (GTP1/OBG family)
MEIGLVGKPNVGKSTLFNALTLLDVPMAPYPFTTTAPNRGVGAVRVPCPHTELGQPCTPGNAACLNGTRWVPINLIDVPGLVPGASEGKGLGHEFLNDLRPADGFLHVVDGSGGTTPEGVLAPKGTQDPAEEVEWLEAELVAWIHEIVDRDFDKHARSAETEGAKPEEMLQKRLAGLAIPMAAITAALRAADVDRVHQSHWSRTQREALSLNLLRIAKPRVVAANKCDHSERAAMDVLAEKVAPVPVVPTCAESELVLRRAARAGLVEYVPGSSSFRVTAPEKLSPPQKVVLERIAGIVAAWGGTGVQQSLESLVLERLQRVVVFPVEDDGKWTDTKGRVLPDAILVPAEATVRDVAYRVHTDLGENFIRAIDGRTHRALGATTVVTPGAVLRIVARK